MSIIVTNNIADLNCSETNKQPINVYYAHVLIHVEHLQYMTGINICLNGTVMRMCFSINTVFLKNLLSSLFMLECYQCRVCKKWKRLFCKIYLFTNFPLNHVIVFLLLSRCLTSFGQSLIHGHTTITSTVATNNNNNKYCYNRLQQ